MTTAEILTVVFAAVAALCACAAFIVSLMRKREGGGVSPSELKNTREELTREIDFARRSIAESNSQSNTAVANMLGAYLENEEKKTDRLSEYMSSAMKELGAAERQNAERTGETLGKNLDAVKAEFKAGVADMRGDMQKQFSEIRRELVENVDKMRAEMKSALTEVRGDNEKQLEKMRATVEEKLSETLDKRVETAFKQVSDRLDSVQKGFGEMKELTSKVGNLNRIFSNVKTRGSWGEVALQSLFEQILSPEQYKTQFRLNPRSQEAVDFVVVMPGQGGEEEVYLPIDAKFPLEDYTRLVEAGDNVSTAAGCKMAQQIADEVTEVCGVPCCVGVGTVAANLRELARSYKEAQLSLDVGSVFNKGASVMSYDNLGIGRLIYQMPTTLCEMFLTEVFRQGSIDCLDDETLTTIEKFFENNLNVSETARKLFVHRNTLVYRLEKIKKLTGLDIRDFDNAIVFKVALMVNSYLAANENKF